MYAFQYFSCPFTFHEPHFFNWSKLHFTVKQIIVFRETLMQDTFTTTCKGIRSLSFYRNMAGKRRACTCEIAYLKILELGYCRSKTVFSPQVLLPTLCWIVKVLQLKMGKRKEREKGVYTIITNADLRHKPIAGSKPLPGRYGSWSQVGDFHIHNCVKIPIQRGPETMNLTINSPPFIWFAANGIGSSSSCIQQLLTINKGQSWRGGTKFINCSM